MTGWKYPKLYGAQSDVGIRIAVVAGQILGKKFKLFPAVTCGKFGLIVHRGGYRQEVGLNRLPVGDYKRAAVDAEGMAKVIAQNYRDYLTMSTVHPTRGAIPRREQQFKKRPTYRKGKLNG